MSGIDSVLRGYEAEAAALITRYRRVPPEAFLAPVRDLLPQNPCRIADIGAGPGFTARWFADQGHDVTAVEPVAAFRAEGQSGPTPVTWLDDRLPGLPRLRKREAVFDLVLLLGVWQHLPAEERPPAMAALAAVMASEAALLMAIRHGPGPAERACYPTGLSDLTTLAAQNGLRQTDLRRAASLQVENRALDVQWSWLRFDRSGH